LAGSGNLSANGLRHGEPQVRPHGCQIEVAVAIQADVHSVNPVTAPGGPVRSFGGDAGPGPVSLVPFGGVEAVTGDAGLPGEFVIPVVGSVRLVPAMSPTGHPRGGEVAQR